MSESTLQDTAPLCPTPPPPDVEPVPELPLWIALREEGNQYFDQRDYKPALAKYTKVIDQFFRTYVMDSVSCFAWLVCWTSRKTPSLTHVHQWKPRFHASVVKEIAYTFSNRCAVYLKLREYQAAYEDATWAITIEPKFAKSYYRLALAARELEKFEEAHQALLRIESIDPVFSRHPLVQEKRYIIESILRDEAEGFRIIQLVAGKDFSIASKFSPTQCLINFYACEMQNCMYLIVDLRTRQALVVDPCWDTNAVLQRLKKHGCSLAGIILGHGHFDHTGGIPPPPFDRYGIRVPGVTTLLPSAATRPCPIYIHPADLPLLNTNDPPLFNSPNLISLRTFCHDKRIMLGNTRIELIHLPGHTEGSQGILVQGCRLLTSDTLFCGGIGRTDLPGGDMKQLVQSLRRLQNFPGSLVVYPGHTYNSSITTIATEKEPGGGLHEDSWKDDEEVHET